MNKKRILTLRIILLVLILVNLFAIFGFSSQPAKKSDQTSQSVTTVIVKTTVKDFEKKPEEEQKAIIKKADPPIRKTAHALEFGSLGCLSLLFLSTFSLSPLLSYPASVVFTAAMGVADELHQKFVSGRAGRLTDVLNDTLGAVFFAGILLLLILVYRKSRKQFRVTDLSVKAPVRAKIAVAADLHGKDGTEVLRAIREADPDYILIPGDLMPKDDLKNPDSNGYAFLRECAAIAPTYYSFGNHEIGCSHNGNPFRKPIPEKPNEAIRREIEKTGAILLDDEAKEQNGILFCGVTSGINGKENRPNASFLAKCAGTEGYHILLCHHPEYYVPYLKQHPEFALIVSGHAHGGQWKIFGKAIYSPNQGLFPKYTEGILDGRCVISRGLGDHNEIPRICNPRELLILHLET